MSVLPGLDEVSWSPSVRCPNFRQVVRYSVPVQHLSCNLVLELHATLGAL